MRVAWDSSEVELTVYTDNTAAIALYRKLGFVEEGVMRDAAFINAAFRDVLQMASIDRTALRP